MTILVADEVTIWVTHGNPQVFMAPSFHQVLFIEDITVFHQV
jgi:hypothetical protein